MKTFVFSALFLFIQANAYADSALKTTSQTKQTDINKTTAQPQTNPASASLTPSVSLRPDPQPTATNKTDNNTQTNQDVRQRAMKKVAAAKKQAQQNQSVPPKKTGIQPVSHQIPHLTTQPETTVPNSQSNQSGVLIQAGAFRTDSLAESQMAKVSLLGMPAQVIKVKDAHGNVMRVVRSRERLNQAEAEALMGRLLQHNVQTLLID